MILTDVFRGISSDWHKIEREAIEKSGDAKAQDLAITSIKELMKEEKMHARVLFLQLWILPIILVYCLGQLSGWLINVYGKQKSVG